jgi:hypothetical protein
MKGMGLSYNNNKQNKDSLADWNSLHFFKKGAPQLGHHEHDTLILRIVHGELPMIYEGATTFSSSFKLSSFIWNYLGQPGPVTLGI